MYLCDIKEPVAFDRAVTSCTKENATNWEFENSSGESTIVHTPKQSNGVWDVGKAGYIKIYGKHGQSNQRFTFKKIDVDKFIILLNQKCIEFNPSTMQYDLRECSSKDEQLFTVSDNLLPDVLIDNHGSMHHDYAAECPINTPFKRDHNPFEYTNERHPVYHHRDGYHRHKCLAYESHGHHGGHH